MESVARHFRNLGFIPRAIIDVGVFKGTYELYDIWPEAQLLLIDPLMEVEPAMRYICDHRKSPASYVVCAAGDRIGQTHLHCSDDLAGSAIASDTGERTVPMYTLDSLEIHLGTGPPYLLKIDVQGAEASVLAGASRILPQCEVVLLETQLFDFHGTGNTLPELITFMKSRGFVPSDFYDGLCRPLDGSLGQIDVAFVKVDGQFRQSHAWGDSRKSARQRVLSRLRRAASL
jgi:FkbM family methyltransferase